ncbi:hypothetical protein [Rhodococcoides fascians]|uniref:hypothetical protein n=1 Tax=Rhodococcoides fascians TaxID=1828 RepID=UPI00068FC873|nr:hypothetical protein [Rhodococcus fascians]
MTRHSRREAVVAIAFIGVLLTGCSNSDEPTDAMPSVIPTVVAGAPATSTEAAPQVTVAPQPGGSASETDSPATPSVDSAPITAVDPAR